MISGSVMRAGSCAAAKEAVPSTSMTATMYCRQISGMVRLLTMPASRVAIVTTTCCTSSARKRCCRSSRSSASSGAWIGDPTVHFLMLVRATSNRVPSWSTRPAGSAPGE